MEPTKEQRFWEQCGFTYHPEYKQFVDCSGRPKVWSHPSLEEPIGIPNTDSLEFLGFLFKYAEHLFVSMACGSINEENWKGAWAKVITHDRQRIVELREEGLTPALALFWAIYQALVSDGTKA